MTPESKARAEIDRLLQAAGWQVCGYKSADIRSARGVAIGEFPLADGHGTDQLRAHDVPKVANSKLTYALRD